MAAILHFSSSYTITSHTSLTPSHIYLLTHIPHPLTHTPHTNLIPHTSLTPHTNLSLSHTHPSPVTTSHISPHTPPSPLTHPPHPLHTPLTPSPCPVVIPNEKHVLEDGQKVQLCRRPMSHLTQHPEHLLRVSDQQSRRNNKLPMTSQYTNQL